LATPDKSALRPNRLERIYDVVAAAGIDVSAWHTAKGDYSSNPNFCYRWAFEGNKVALLCIWFHSINWVDGAWVSEGNARARQQERETAGADHWDPAVRNRTKRWAKSAIQLDGVIQQAYRNKLEVRVCIVDTRTRAGEFETASADYRALDPIPWQLTYDMMTGEYSVRRDPEPSPSATLDGFEAPGAGVTTQDISEAPEASTAPIEADVRVDAAHEPITAPALPEITPTSYGVGVVDQFVVDEVQGDPVAVQRFERERSAVVRQLVMARSQGCCEWCGQPGFIKHDGQIYLESHHVVPLHQDGDDTVENVIALCPNDHRIAHYGEGRDTLAIEMLIRIEERLEHVQAEHHTVE
jgi:hypothetical protein